MKHVDLSIFELKGYLLARENEFIQVAAVTNEHGRMVMRVLVEPPREPSTWMNREMYEAANSKAGHVALP